MPALLFFFHSMHSRIGTQRPHDFLWDMLRLSRNAAFLCIWRFFSLRYESDEVYGNKIFAQISARMTNMCWIRVHRYIILSRESLLKERHIKPFVHISSKCEDFLLPFKWAMGKVSRAGPQYLGDQSSSHSMYSVLFARAVKKPLQEATVEAKHCFLLTAVMSPEQLRAARITNDFPFTECPFLYHLTSPSAWFYWNVRGVFLYIFASVQQQAEYLLTLIRFAWE